MIILLPTLALFTINYLISTTSFPSLAGSTLCSTLLSAPLHSNLLSADTEDQVVAAAAVVTITPTFMRYYHSRRRRRTGLFDLSPMYIDVGQPPMTKALAIRPKYELSVQPKYEIFPRPAYELLDYEPFDFATYYVQGLADDESATEMFHSLSQLGVFVTLYALLLSLMMAR